MNSKPIYINNTKFFDSSNKVNGLTIFIENEWYYKISNSNFMRPFFMSIVSDANHWMFISSNGGLTAGRKDCDLALFPYYTDDKITEGAEITGSKTILLIDKEDKAILWEPFSNKYEGAYTIQRNLYKNSIGNKIMFEEENIDLGLTFRYQWNTSNLYGFIKKTSIQNNTHQNIKIKVLDGIQNIVPYGVNSNLQNEKSNLVDAYKKNELEVSVGLGIYSLSAIIVDKAVPSEALKATIAWSLGLENDTHLISSVQLNNFRKGINLKKEIDVRAEKGAYFISSVIAIEAKSEKKWIVGANVNQKISDIIHISEKLKLKDQFYNEVLKNIELGTENLIELTGNADGIQLTSDKLQNTRHFANTLFNCMRGGVFNENYTIEKSDFTKYILKANKTVFKNTINQLNQFSENFSLNKLKEITLKSTDIHFIRLCLEYMPLKFSRKHGDPSRPWNKFSINTQSEMDGSNILDYQGNWRDIFQNWEALVISYPEFIESMIFKFLNASTFDGYNPYRITKDGFDWEVIELDNPWSFIGYWGDHQIIYLLKFLEFVESHYPNKLANYFNQELFVYANVPYKIKNYSGILKNAKDTIEFDIDLDKKIKAKKIEIGADGALLLNRKNKIHTVNLIEKLLAIVLAKFSNFIPEGGIWLNTQRPEWNDANNALVGNGVSMVTLYYLRRFLHFFKEVISIRQVEEVNISEEMKLFFNEITQTLQQNRQVLSGKISNKKRKLILDGLGTAGSNFRNTIYKNGFSAKKTTISRNDLLNFTKVALAFIDHSIKVNKRKDNLYNAYNLMTIETEDEISISSLQEMLEGQVAVLSAGVLSASEVLAVLNSLRNSTLFREDQYSYLLYPNKELSRFVNKNNIPLKEIDKSILLRQLLKDENFQIIEKDDLGNYHFNGNFNNANSLKKALINLP